MKHRVYSNYDYICQQLSV